jgi:hypothetical protein
MRHALVIAAVHLVLLSMWLPTASAQWRIPCCLPAASPESQAQTPADAEKPAPKVTATAHDPKTAPPRTAPTGLLTPIPENGGLPRIYSQLYDITAEQMNFRAKARGYGRQIAKIKHNHFGDVRVAEIRQQGLEKLREFSDPAAFRAMIDELAREADDVRLGMLDHFAMQGEEGQAALGWLAIYDKDQAIQNEALTRMVTPAAEPVKYLLNSALRTKDHKVMDAAATVAGALSVLEAIPLLIFGQAVVTGTERTEGDLAWIAIQTQRAYVQNLIPIVGDGSAAFQPVIGIVSDGVVMRVMDAVVIEYRTPVHNALVAMTTHDWGQPTEYLSYNIRAWWDWYNNQYVPFKNEQAAKAAVTGS